MGFIKMWTMSVAGAVIFGALCEMLAPDNGLKKYIRVILGLVLITAVVKPLVGAGDKDLLAGAIGYVNGLTEVDVIQKDSERNMVIREYKKRLINEMLARIKNISQDCDIDIKLEIETGSERVAMGTDKNFGEITDVLVMVGLNGDANTEKLKKDINKILTADFGVIENRIRYFTFSK